MTVKMHADEFDIDASLIRRLLEQQFPQWAALPIERVELMGTENALYRVGSEMVARLPRIERAAASLEHERRWLPRIGDHVPISVPRVLGEGAPGSIFPLTWSVYSWLPGERVTPESVRSPQEFALDLAGLVAALQRMDTTDGPAPAEHSGGRGEPLANREAQTSAWFGDLDAVGYPTDALKSIWKEALSAPVWAEPPVWLHGDLDAQNLLVDGGRLTGVIDFGCVGVGDPACDVMVAWKVLTPRGRETFRAALSIDEATWVRARGWAVSQAVGVLAYYTEENHPVLVRAARHWVAEVTST
jgi:aminoglycoside phosphotransferase (APT) family kinase protein